MPIEDERFSIEPLLTEPIVLAVSKEKQRWMPLEMTALIDKALEGEGSRKPCVLLEMEAYGFRRMVLDLCAESGFKPNAAFKTSTSKSRNPLSQMVWGNTGVKYGQKGQRSGCHLFIVQSAPSRTLVFVF